jgi:hypothetical protein
VLVPHAIIIAQCVTRHKLANSAVSKYNMVFRVLQSRYLMAAVQFPPQVFSSLGVEDLTFFE